MPRNTPLTKVTATRGHGAKVVLHGNNYDETFEAALKQSETSGATFLHAFDDEDVIAGQGTIGLEMLRQNPQLEVLVVPVGGGGLIGGVACAAKSKNPEIEVIGVQTAPTPLHAGSSRPQRTGERPGRVDAGRRNRRAKSR